MRKRAVLSETVTMFDDYVEHSAPAQAVSKPITLPPLQYEGFEPDDGRHGLPENDPVISPTNIPIFELGRVQYTFPAALIAFAVCSDMLVMGLSTNAIVLIELSRSDQIIKIQLPPKPSDMTIYKLFMDPSGRHIVVTSTQGQNWYLYRTWKKPRQLKGFKMVIESIAWNKAALLSTSHSTSTREILIGGKNGIIYEAVLDAEEDFFKSQERYLQAVFTLPERHPITGLRFDLFPSPEQKKALIVVTTPTRIYQFIGIPDRKSEEGGRVFSSLFATYRDNVPKILELPGDIPRTELQYFTLRSDQPNALPRNMAWLTGQGIYHGTLKFDLESEDQIDSAQLLPDPLKDGSSTSTPISMALTEFHFILLYRDRVIGICNLNDQVVYEETIPLGPDETVLGLAADPVRKTYWVYTDQSLFELVVANEDRDVWKLYLDKGNYEVSLRYVKSASQRDAVLASQANALFDEARYFNAAQCYSQTSITFEEVTLKFLDVGERDALRSYLISRLERTRKTDLTQRMILATWLVEIYLSKCNELEDAIASQAISNDMDNFQAEKMLIEDDLKQFLETYKNHLDPTTVYELIQSHGRTDIYLYCADVIKDHERIIEHWVLEEEWTKAIEIISGQSNPNLYYKFSSVLMRHAPKETADSWLRQPLLDPVKLVPALLQSQHAPQDPSSSNHAIRYLNHVIFEQQSTSSTIHNLLITFYVSPSSTSHLATADDDEPLLRFLANAPTDPLSGKPYYDLDYALRLCKHAGRIHPCVHIYSKMGMWENSVDLALEKGDLELAKVNADMPEEDIALRKRLWLKVARYVVQDKKDIRSAMRFLENTNLLKIEDILPFFPDFVVIDDFKEEIAHALEGYSSQIESLKNEMDEATRTAESIKQDIAGLRNRFITIDSAELCSSCSRQLVLRQFYVFPCRHCFHADCLIALAKEYLPAHSLRKIVSLQDQLVDKSVVPTIIPASRNASTHLVRQPTKQRTLLSTNFGLANPARAANLLGRSVISAGDKLRDLIVPDALATLVLAPANWIPGIGGGQRPIATLDESKKEKLRAELEDILAGSCPLCESVVVGLDKPFITEETDTSWEL